MLLFVFGFVHAMRGIDQSEYLRVFHYLPVLVTCLGYACLVSALDLAFVFHILTLFWSYISMFTTILFILLHTSTLSVFFSN